DAGRAFFKKRRRFDFSDRQRIVNESVGVFFRSARLFLHLQRLFHPGDMARLVTLRRGQDQAQQFNLGPLITAEDRFRGLGGFDAGAHEFRSYLESSLGCIRVMKRSGVGEQRGVEAFGAMSRMVTSTSLSSARSNQ